MIIFYNWRSNLINFEITGELDSLETRQNVMCFPVSRVVSTFLVKSGSDHGRFFKCSKNVRSWNSAGSDIVNLSLKRKFIYYFIIFWWICVNLLKIDSLKRISSMSSWASFVGFFWPCKSMDFSSLCCDGSKSRIFLRDKTRSMNMLYIVLTIKNELEKDTNM